MMAKIRLQIDPVMSEEVRKALAKRQQKPGRIVKELLVQEVPIDRLAPRHASPVPAWVPRGKYVAVVRGVIPAVGDSAVVVASEAMSKFPREPVFVERKGAPLARIEYAYAALRKLHCWRYPAVGETEFSENLAATRLSLD